MEELIYKGTKYFLAYKQEVEDGNIIKNKLGTYLYNNKVCTNIIDGSQYLITDLSGGNLIYKK